MNPDIEKALIGLGLLIIGGMGTKGLPLFWEWLKSNLETSQQREQREFDEHEQEETLERETRQIVNQVALDKSRQLSELQKVYVEQSEVVRKQIDEIHRLGTELANCRDIQVLEYKRQVDLLLAQIATQERTESDLRQIVVDQQKTIAKLKVDIQILETTK